MALDILVLIIIGLSMIVAFFRGFIREVLTIAGLVGASFAALKFGDNLVPTISGWLSDPVSEESGKIFDLIPVSMAALVLGYLFVFVVVMIVLSIATHYIAKGAQSIGLGVLDRSLGILFGFVRGAVLIGLLYLPFHHLLGEEEKQRWFSSAKSYVYVEYAARLMQAFIPSVDEDETKQILQAQEIEEKIKNAIDDAKDNNEEPPAMPEAIINQNKTSNSNGPTLNE